MMSQIPQFSAQRSAPEVLSTSGVKIRSSGVWISLPHRYHLLGFCQRDMYGVQTFMSSDCLTSPRHLDPSILLPVLSELRTVTCYPPMLTRAKDIPPLDGPILKAHLSQMAHKYIENEDEDSMNVQSWVHLCLSLYARCTPHLSYLYLSHSSCRFACEIPLRKWTTRRFEHSVLYYGLELEAETCKQKQWLRVRDWCLPLHDITVCMWLWPVDILGNLSSPRLSTRIQWIPFWLLTFTIVTHEIWEGTGLRPTQSISMYWFGSCW